MKTPEQAQVDDEGVFGTARVLEGRPPDEGDAELLQHGLCRDYRHRVGEAQPLASASPSTRESNTR